MSTSTKIKMPTSVPEPTAVRCDDATLTVDLSDGRTISAPIVWYPRLLHATVTERANVELGHDDIHWPDLNEDIPVSGLLNGQKSGESLKSIRRWLDLRARGLQEEVPTLPLPDWFNK